MLRARERPISHPPEVLEAFVRRAMAVGPDDEPLQVGVVCADMFGPEAHGVVVESRGR